MKAISNWKRELRLLGLFKIPMVGYTRPRITELDTEHCIIRIRLTRRTKNHLGSMYFGALSVGADLSPGLLCFYLAEQQGVRISFAFKAVEGTFIKRAETAVYFECSDAKIISQSISDSKSSGERMNQPVRVSAKNDLGEEVASFIMTLSVKVIQ